MRAWDAIGDLPDPGSDVLPLGTWASDLLPSIPEGGNYQWLTAKGGGDEVFGYRTRYWSFLLKLAKDRPSWTLSASGGPSTGPFHWNNRQLTVRERLRLQSFPDDWKLSGSVRSQVRMAGNATPPLLAEIIGRAIAQQILHPGTTLDQRTSPSLPRKRTVPAAVDPVPVPKRLQYLIGKKKAHPGAGFGPSPRYPG
jgi:DNA (cytosine-5)-methyltransferase 1